MRRYLVETRHGYMHMRTFGTGGTPLALLHMGPLSGQMFDRVAPLLAADRCVVVPDRIGYGDSDPLSRQLEIAEYAQATLDALDEVGVERFDVVGVHTGSCEALELATTHPERVRRVGLLGLLAFSAEERQAFLGRHSTRAIDRAHPRQPRKVPELAEDGEQLLWRWRRWVRNRPRAWKLEEVQRCLVDELRSASWSQLSLKPIFSYPWVERLAQVRQPLLVFAAHDYLWESTQRALLSAPAGTRVVEVPLDPPGTAPTGLFSFAADEMAGHIRGFLA